MSDKAAPSSSSSSSDPVEILKAQSNTNPTYWAYLHLDQLLSCQNGIDAKEEDVSSDELHFIIVHQCLELWFKLILKQLRLARDELASERVTEEKIPFVVHHLKRVLEILRVAVDHFRVMETLTPQDFLAFRGKLGTASGFQSYQLREMEILLGLEAEQLVKIGEGNALDIIKKFISPKDGPLGQHAWNRIESAQAEINIKTALEQWLYRTPIHGSGPTDPNDEQVVTEFLNGYIQAHEKLQREQAESQIASGVDTREKITSRFEGILASIKSFLFATEIENPEERKRVSRIRSAILFIESYRDLPLLAWPRTLLDTIIELEQGFVIWRQRHVRMVERMIGRRIGTGGSSGVDYLDKTVNYRIFTNLWQARTALLPKFAVPQLKNAKFYDFHTNV
jgi:tryptophan 2,3-dioxygenase